MGVAGGDGEVPLHQAISRGLIEMIESSSECTWTNWGWVGA